MTNTLLPIKMGVIGCGKVAMTRHLPILDLFKRADVTAIADVDPKNLERAKNAFRIKRTYSSHTELLQDADVDAVAICTPLTSHAEVALDAMAAGKHVLLEKPLTMSLDEVDQLIERAVHIDKKVMVGYNKRWHRLIRKSKEIICHGSLGDVRMIQVIFSTGNRNRFIPEWRLNRGVGGGSLIENGSHFYDLWHFLMGRDIHKVSASSHSSEQIDDELSVVTAETENGQFLNCILSDFLPDRFEMDVFGEECILHASMHRFDGLEFIPLQSFEGDMKNRVKRAAGFFKALPAGILQARKGGDYHASFRDMWAHFVDSIVHDTPMECTLEDGRKSLQIALAATESASTGKTIFLRNSAGSITLPS